MKRHDKNESAALWKWLESRPKKWWIEGREFGPKFGWPEVYEADNWHCIYCGKDLAENEDAFAEATKEHLVAQSLFTGSDRNPHHENNVAVCCSACNELKGPHMPEINTRAWSSRREFILAMREFIGAERAKRAAEYRARAFKALARRIWSEKSTRQKDYLG
jgi:5-methylcytosine-specific restriction endonuclease McrA